MVNSQIQDYKAKAVLSMSKGEQLILLYEEAIKNLRFACIMLKKDDMTNFFKCTTKAKDVFAYLSSILDKNYEISKDLASLYAFFNTELIKAEKERSCEPIEPLIPIVEDLKDTWKQADKQLHQNRQ